MLNLADVEKRIKEREKDLMSDKSQLSTEDILVSLISSGHLKAKIDKQQKSIVFSESGSSVSDMVKTLEEQTLKIIKSIKCLEDVDIELIKS